MSEMNLSAEPNITKFCHPSEEQKIKDLLTRNGLVEYTNLVTPIEFVKPKRVLAVDNNNLMYCFLLTESYKEEGGE